MEFVNLTVEGVENNNGRIVIKSGGKSYSFFQSKKDGTPSRAQQDFEKLGVSLGKTYAFGVSESEGVNSKTGAPIVFRNIGVIGEASERASVAEIPSKAPVADFRQTAEYKRITQVLHTLAEKVKALEEVKLPTINLDDEQDEIKIEDIPF